VSAVPIALGIAVNCGSTAAYGRFVSDTNYSSGMLSTHANTIITTGLVNPAPMNVYQSFHLGTAFNYTFTNLPADLYNVRLHFCETYFTASNSRVFNTFINGTQVLTNFDIWTAAGGQNHAYIREFTTLANSTNAIIIQFNRIADNAAINGIELVPILPPSAPTGVSATAGDVQVIINWAASVGAISYNVKRSFTAGSEVVVTNIASSSFTDFNVTNGGTYYYVVTAIGTGGESTPSVEVVASPSSMTAFQLWQIRYFGSTNNPLAAPEADASGTGQNNLFKYNAGLNPTNPASVFVFKMMGMSNGPILCFGPIASNRTYSVQWRTDLWAGSWSPLPEVINAMTNGNQMILTDTNGIPPAKFYRVGISVP
jgi:hypothetical protein